MTWQPISTQASVLVESMVYPHRTNLERIVSIPCDEKTSAPFGNSLAGWRWPASIAATFKATAVRSLWLRSYVRRKKANLLSLRNKGTGGRVVVRESDAHVEYLDD